MTGAAVRERAVRGPERADVRWTPVAALAAGTFAVGTHPPTYPPRRAAAPARSRPRERVERRLTAPRRTLWSVERTEGGDDRRSGAGARGPGTGPGRRPVDPGRGPGGRHVRDRHRP